MLQNEFPFVEGTLSVLELVVQYTLLGKKPMTQISCYVCQSTVDLTSALTCDGKTFCGHPDCCEQYLEAKPVVALFTEVLAYANPS